MNTHKTTTIRATSTKRPTHLKTASTSTRGPTPIKTNGKGHSKARVGRAANDLLKDSKKLGNAIYRQGVNKVNETQDNLQEYSDQVLHKVQQNPLASVLIAAGVGFLLSSIFRK